VDATVRLFAFIFFVVVVTCIVGFLLPLLVYTCAKLWGYGSAKGRYTFKQDIARLEKSNGEEKGP
jgi:hypothetical protein